MNKRESKFRYWAVLIAIIAALLFIAVYGLFTYWFGFKLPYDSQSWGHFGDYSGGVLNPIFGLLTLWAVLTALHIQSEELFETREALKKQSDRAEVQSFEVGLFSQIDIHHSNLQSIQLSDGENKYESRGVFKVLYARLKDSYVAEQSMRDSPDDFAMLKAAYTRFYRTNEQYIDFYLKYTNQLVAYVNIRCPSNHEHYWSILRTQFSDHELLIIYYHEICNSKYRDGFPLKNTNFFSSLDEMQFLKTHHKSLLGDIK